MGATASKDRSRKGSKRGGTHIVERCPKLTELRREVEKDEVMVSGGHATREAKGRRKRRRKRRRS